jgi:hypothetical protein
MPAQERLLNPAGCLPKPDGLVSRTGNQAPPIPGEGQARDPTGVPLEFVEQTPTARLQDLDPVGLRPEPDRQQRFIRGKSHRVEIPKRHGFPEGAGLPIHQLQALDPVIPPASFSKKEPLETEEL